MLAEERGMSRRAYAERVVAAPTGAEQAEDTAKAMAYVRAHLREEFTDDDVREAWEWRAAIDTGRLGPYMVTLDHTAVLALCRGHRLVSGLAVVEAEIRSSARVPALCLVAAGLEHPGVAAYAGALPGLEFLPLDFAGAAAVEQLAAAWMKWPCVHAVCAAASDGVEGQILTARPEADDGTGVWAVDIGQP